MFTDEVVRAIESVREDFAALRSLQGSKRYEAGIAVLEKDLDVFLEACQASVKELSEEAWDARADFDLRYRRLIGLSEEFSVLSRKRPEQSCGAFKARQINLVLEPLRDELEEVPGVTLSLVAEDGSLTYSDVSLMIRNYLDLSAVCGQRRYHLRCDEKRH